MEPEDLNRFEQILDEISGLHYKKSLDYGTDEDPYNNVRHSEDWGIPSWMGAMIRANDKMERIKKYAKQGHLANESARDSFLDFIVYGIIALILWEETNGSKTAEGNSFCP